MGFKVGLTDAAQDDLAALVRFLAQKNPEAARGSEMKFSRSLCR
jgi:plasmid stabilization system protein ParE